MKRKQGNHERDASALWAVRTPAEMALVLEVLGHAPFLGEVERIRSGVVVWRARPPETGPVYRFEIERPEAPPGDFGPGTSPALDPADLRRHAETLVRSVPSIPDKLGPHYLDQILERLALALACREQLGRYLAEGAEAIAAEHFHEAPANPAPYRRAAIAADDARLAERVASLRTARAALGPRPEPKDLPYAEGTYLLPAAAAKELFDPPYPVARLEELAKRGWGLVDASLPDRPQWGMLRHPGGALLLVRVRENQEIVEQHVIEEADALTGLAAHGCRLTTEVGIAVLRAVAVGARLADAQQKLNVLPIKLEPVTGLPAGEGRLQQFTLVEQLAPRRRTALLALVLDGDTVAGRHLLDGPAVMDQVERLAERPAAKQVSDQTAQFLAATEEVREGLRARFLPFVEPGADLRSLSAALRPRPDDAAKAFVGAAAARVQAASDAAWASANPPILGPRPGQTDVTAVVCPARMLGTEGPLTGDFPRAMHNLAPYLDPARVWGTLRFHRPGESRGMRYDGLVWIEDRWVWFPKAWRWIRA
jgi:hypothetical protein